MPAALLVWVMSAFSSYDACASSEDAFAYQDPPPCDESDMPIVLDASPDEPEPYTDRSPLESRETPAMTCPVLSMVSTPSVPSGAPLRNAPASFARMSTSFAAAPAAAPVARRVEGASVDPAVLLVEMRISPKLGPLPTDWADLFVVAAAPTRLVRASAKIGDTMNRLRSGFATRS